MNSFTTALVTDNSDPDNLGRVKVRYPWSAENDESYWARVSTLMAGDEQGFYMIPEIDQEVLVAFINGNLQYPIVIGTLWNQESMPPQNNEDGNNDIKKIRSRSGHEIVFDDGENPKLEILTASGHRISLDDSSGSEKIVIEDNAGASLVFDSTSNAIEIEAGMDISIKATKITLDASGELVLKGGMVRIN